MGKCVIIGAGDCDTEMLGRKLVLGEGDVCIAADGGLDYLIRIGITPDIVLGDMDSLQAGDVLQELERAQKVRIKKLPAEKDDTDMFAAIKEGLALGFVSFEIYGALGGRFDHAVANLQSLMYLLNHGARGLLVGNNISVRLIRNERIAFPAGEYGAGRKISVFAYGRDAQGVTVRGLKYPLDGVVVKQEFPIGVSNEFTGEDAQISVESGMLLICVEEET